MKKWRVTRGVDQKVAYDMIVERATFAIEELKKQYQALRWFSKAYKQC
jgi:hypothetical protein